MQTSNLNQRIAEGFESIDIKQWSQQIQFQNKKLPLVLKEEKASEDKVTDGPSGKLEVDHDQLVSNERINSSMIPSSCKINCSVNLSSTFGDRDDAPEEQIETICTSFLDTQESEITEEEFRSVDKLIGKSILAALNRPTKNTNCGECMEHYSFAQISQCF
jgi:hypothetical protein